MPSTPAASRSRPPTANSPTRSAAARERGNLQAGVDPAAYGLADTIVIDVPLDIDWRSETPDAPPRGLRSGDSHGRATWVRPGALVIVETTVPPGTTQRIVVPLFSRIACATVTSTRARCSSRTATSA